MYETNIHDKIILLALFYWSQICVSKVMSNECGLIVQCGIISIRYIISFIHSITNFHNRLICYFILLQKSTHLSISTLMDADCKLNITEILIILNVQKISSNLQEVQLHNLQTY